jgi:hypothetical protein
VQEAWTSAVATVEHRQKWSRFPNLVFRIPFFRTRPSGGRILFSESDYPGRFCRWIKTRNCCVRQTHKLSDFIYIIDLRFGDPHEVGYSLNNGGHNISFGKCTRGLTILDPKFGSKANSYPVKLQYNWWWLVPTTNHISSHCSVNKTPTFSSAVVFIGSLL